MSLRGGTVGMPSKGNSMVAISSNTIASRSGGISAHACVCVGGGGGGGPAPGRRAGGQAPRMMWRERSGGLFECPQQHTWARATSHSCIGRTTPIFSLGCFSPAPLLACVGVAVPRAFAQRHAAAAARLLPRHQRLVVGWLARHGMRCWCRCLAAGRSGRAKGRPQTRGVNARNWSGAVAT